MRFSSFAEWLSIPILLKTLFEPWKQIKTYTGQNTPFNVKIHIFFDNLFARAIGFLIRTFVIIFGLIVLLGVTIFGIILAVLWPIVPALPVVFIIMAVQSA